MAGRFTEIDGTPRNSLAAIYTDGTLSTGWNPNANGGGVYVLAASGSTVYVGGDFTSIGGTPRIYFAAIDTNGNLN